MIFLTVGTQLPFERLVSCVDEFSGVHQDLEIYGQIGSCIYRPRNFVSVKELTIKEFEEKLSEASLIISHAGMGSIITALCNNKPICIMPRRVEYNEHRNNHQVGTALKFKIYRGCFVFEDLDSLEDAYIRSKSITLDNKVSKYASREMLGSIFDIVNA